MALKRALSAALAGSPVDASALEEAIAQVFVSEDEALRQTLVRAREHGLPPIQISALQGKLLQVLAAACQARKILEIGALAGYSGIWLSRALPVDGRLITLEVDAISAELVRESCRWVASSRRPSPLTSALTWWCPTLASGSSAQQRT